MGVQCLLDCLSRVWCLSGYKITNKWTIKAVTFAMGIGNEYGHFFEIFFAEVVTVKMVKINGYYAQFYIQFV